MIESGPGALQIRLRLRDGGLSLTHLLIQIRCFDFGQELPRADAISDIHKPAFDVAFCAGQDRSLGDRLNISGERQLADRSGLLYAHYADVRQRRILRVGLSGHGEFPLVVWNVANEERHQHTERCQEKQSEQGEGGWPARVLERRVHCGLSLLLLQLALQRHNLRAQLVLVRGCARRDGIVRFFDGRSCH